MQFAQKISSLMRAHGLSQRSLAEALHTSNATVAGWCNGAKPRAAVVKRVADHFDVPVEVLIDDALDLPAAPARAARESSVGYGVDEVLEKLPPEISGPIREEVRAYLSKFDERIAALDAKIAALDASLAEHPAVAEALANGLTVAEVRAMIRAEIARRKGAAPGREPYKFASEPGERRFAADKPDAVQEASDAGKRRGFREQGVKTGQAAAEPRHKKSG